MSNSVTEKSENIKIDFYSKRTTDDPDKTDKTEQILLMVYKTQRTS